MQLLNEMNREDRSPDLLDLPDSGFKALFGRGKSNAALSPQPPREENLAALPAIPAGPTPIQAQRKPEFSNAILAEFCHGVAKGIAKPSAKQRPNAAQNGGVLQ